MFNAYQNIEFNDFYNNNKKSYYFIRLPGALSFQKY